MLWKRKKERQPAANGATEPTGAGFHREAWRQFRRNRQAVWTWRTVLFLALVALLADFLASDKPLYCQLDGKTYFPVVQQYAADLGLYQWEARFINEGWRDQAYDRVIWPLVPYAYFTIDRRNRNYVSPFAEQNIPSWRWRHWLGTDKLGRDVLAGMIRGTRVAMLVGIVAMSIAFLIGVFMGAVAGYFGDRGLQISRSRLLLILLGLGLGIFYGFTVRSFAISEGVWLWEVGKGIGIVAVLVYGLQSISRWLDGIPALGRKMYFPADLLIMRLIETFNSIPALLLILAIVAVVEQPSIFIVMAVIGFIRWTSIARFTRAEILRIRQMEYVEAAQILGLEHWRIIWRHVLPNALTPILITLAFGIAGAVLLEAFLSFLNVGMPAESITWGSMLNEAKGRAAAWWLAVFPGLAIFVTVTAFNLLGDGLTQALDRRA